MISDAPRLHRPLAAGGGLFNSTGWLRFVLALACIAALGTFFGVRQQRRESELGLMTTTITNNASAAGDYAIDTMTHRVSSGVGGGATLPRRASAAPAALPASTQIQDDVVAGKFDGGGGRRGGGAASSSLFNRCTPEEMAKYNPASSLTPSPSSSRPPPLPRQQQPRQRMRSSKSVVNMGKMGNQMGRGVDTQTLLPKAKLVSLRHGPGELLASLRGGNILRVVGVKGRRGHTSKVHCCCSKYK